MNITIAIYDFKSNAVRILSPLEVIKETEKCYFAEHSRRLKGELGKPILKGETAYPYVYVAMIDATPEDLRSKLAEWFEEKANYILTTKTIMLPKQ